MGSISPSLAPYNNDQLLQGLYILAVNGTRTEEDSTDRECIVNSMGVFVISKLPAFSA